MKILAPVNSVKEAKILSKLGAEELYCGLSERAWRKSHGQDFWISRRGPGNANVESLKELHKLVVVAHKAGSQVFLTLNQPGYAPELYEDILTTVRQAQEYCGVDAFIVADPGLIRFLNCLLYTSDAADEEDSVDLGGRRIIKKKKRR